MLESFRLWPQIHARLESGPLAPHLGPFVAALNEEGYTRSVVRRYLQAADRFTLWLQRHKISASAIDEAVVARYIRGLRRTRRASHSMGRLPEIASGVRKLARFLWEHRVAERQQGEERSHAREQWLREYEFHLEHVQGVSVGTRRMYLQYARRLCRARFGDTVPVWSALTAGDIAEFVQQQAAALKPAASRAPVTAVRAMLRYLVLTGAVRAGLEGAVPTIRQWKQASLPRYLSAEQFQRLVDGYRGKTLAQRRDRAILLLLGRLGLRAGEVVALHLEDIQWTEGRLLIRAGKTARERVLPLTQETGQALAAYLRCRGAAGVPSFVFMRLHPRQRPLTTGAVSTLVARALRRAGIETPHPGAHVLRHTAATQMVRRGVPFKEVADVLGHACMETTALYAKLDLDSLAGVALPWPGGTP